MIQLFLILIASTICIEFFIKLNLIKYLKQLFSLVKNFKSIKLFDKNLTDDDKEKEMKKISINLIRINFKLLIYFTISVSPFLLLFIIDIFISLNIMFYLEKIEVIISTILYVFLYKVIRQKFLS